MKHPVFSVDERVETDSMVDVEHMQESCLAGRFEPDLLVDYVTFRGRELPHPRPARATMDFEQFQINALNRHLAPDIDTVYFMARPGIHF